MPIDNKKPKYNTAKRRVARFITAEHSGDALRNLATILLPCLLLFYLVDLHTAIGIGVGTLMASLTDLPGNRADKWKSATYCIPVFAMATFLTASTFSSPVLLIACLMLSAFAYTMLTVFGPRPAAVGSLALILMSFIMGLRPTSPVELTIHITIGACWYYLISILQARITPYRSLRYAMADGFHHLAVLLQAKAACYNPEIPIEQTYRKLGKVHIQVSDSQEGIRRLLLREEKLLSPEMNSAWLNRIYGLIDLHELLTALDYDYEAIRQTLGTTGALAPIQSLIRILSREVEAVGHAQQFKTSRNTPITQNGAVDKLLVDLGNIRNQHPAEVRTILDAIIQNIKAIVHLIGVLQKSEHNYAEHGKTIKNNEYHHFIPLSNSGWQTLRNNLTGNSTVFTFALRLALLFGLGGLLGMWMPQPHYAYWILLTLAIVARPSFINTKQRNIQRITGTLTGLTIGILLLQTVHHIPTLLGIAALGLFGFFMFNRPNYMISVIFITVAVMLALNIHEGNIERILESRLLFTFTGASLAIIGCYFIPVQQKSGMKNLANEVVRSSVAYLKTLEQQLQGNTFDNYAVRLARKNTQTILAAFSDTMHQLQTEPTQRKKDWTAPNAFHTLAYRINSLTIGLSVNIGNQCTDFTKQLQLSERSNNISNLLTDLNQLARGL